MGWFKNLIKRRGQSKETVFQLGSFGGMTPSFYATGGDLMRNEAVEACITTNATYCSKVEFSSVRVKENGAAIHDWKQMDKLLQVRPNPLMSAAVFWERVRTFYDRYNNAFVYLERDAAYNIVAFWALDPTEVRFKKISTGELVLLFRVNGVEQVHTADEIVHIPRNVTGNQVFGMETNESIRRVVEMIDLNYQGLEKAIVNSAYIRFIGEMVTAVSEAEKRRKAKKFTEMYLRTSKDDPVGIAITDGTMKLTPVPAQKQDHASYMEASAWNDAIYRHFGVPKQVISGTATEAEMTAYYERTIEPFFTRVAQELTAKIFTDREYECGNRIVFNDRKLQYMTTATRLQLFNAAREIGAFTYGTLGDLLGLPVPEENRDKIVTSQNYIESKKTEEEKENDEQQ